MNTGKEPIFKHHTDVEYPESKNDEQIENNNAEEYKYQELNSLTIVEAKTISKHIVETTTLQSMSESEIKKSNVFLSTILFGGLIVWLTAKLFKYQHLSELFIQQFPFNKLELVTRNYIESHFEKTNMFGNLWIFLSVEAVVFALASGLTYGLYNWGKLNRKILANIAIVATLITLFGSYTPIAVLHFDFFISERLGDFICFIVTMGVICYLLVERKDKEKDVGLKLLTYIYFLVCCTGVYRKIKIKRIKQD